MAAAGVRGSPVSAVRERVPVRGSGGSRRRGRGARRWLVALAAAAVALALLQLGRMRLMAPGGPAGPLKRVGVPPLPGGEASGTVEESALVCREHDGDIDACVQDRRRRCAYLVSGACVDSGGTRWLGVDACWFGANNQLYALHNVLLYFVSVGLKAAGGARVGRLVGTCH